MALLDQTQQTSSLSGSSSAGDETEARIQGIWQRSLPMVRARLDLLAAAAAAAQAHTLADPVREEALSIAHKLAGSLGLFGFPEGTELARELEAALAAPALNPERLIQLAERLRATIPLAA